jgi:hypothetical protein
MGDGSVACHQAARRLPVSHLIEVIDNSQIKESSSVEGV